MGGDSTFLHSAVAHGRSETTVYRKMMEFAYAVCKVLGPMYIKFPVGQAAIDVADRCEIISGFPNIVGLVDGTHMPISKPGKDQKLYYNYKHFHSLNT